MSDKIEIYKFKETDTWEDYVRYEDYRQLKIMAIGLEAFRLTVWKEYGFELEEENEA